MAKQTEAAAEETVDTEAAAAEGKFYCPGCGKRSDTADTCEGGELPHQPIQMVSTKELDGPEDKHTPAPPSE